MVCPGVEVPVVVAGNRHGLHCPIMARKAEARLEKQMFLFSPTVEKRFERR
jgi:hypothetical protein